MPPANSSSPPGVAELAYVENATDLSVTGSSGSPTTWIDFGSVYMDGSPVYLMCATPSLSSSGNCIIEIKQDGSSLLFPSGSASRIAQFTGISQPWSYISPRWTPSVGWHTYKLVAWTTSGTPTIFGSNGGIFVPSWAALMKVAKLG